MGEGPADSGQLSAQDQVANQLAGNNQASDNSTETPVAPVTQEQPTINPAWNPLLEVLPASLHGMVTPHLTKWDQGVQQMVQKVHSEYAPWKAFQDAQLDPEALYQSYQIQQALEADPQKFIEAVMQHYGMEFEQGQQDQLEENDGEEELGLVDFTQDPEFQRQQQMTETMAQYLIAQQQAQDDAAEDKQLDADLKAAKEKHGDFDEDWVLQRVMYFNEDPDTAVQKYHQHVQQIITNHRNPSAGAPVIMGSGGGTPVTPTVTSNMSGKDRRALMVQMLANAHANGD